jgi:hypothetical protein
VDGVCLSARQESGSTGANRNFSLVIQTEIFPADEEAKAGKLSLVAAAARPAADHCKNSLRV